jgi:hypothetical protein
MNEVLCKEGVQIGQYLKTALKWHIMIYVSLAKPVRAVLKQKTAHEHQIKLKMNSLTLRIALHGSTCQDESIQKCIQT